MTHSSLPISSSSSSTCSSPSFAQSTSTIWIQSTSSMPSQTHYIITSGIIATSARSMTSEKMHLASWRKMHQHLASRASTRCIWDEQMTSKETSAVSCLRSDELVILTVSSRGGVKAHPFCPHQTSETSKMHRPCILAQASHPSKGAMHPA